MTGIELRDFIFANGLSLAQVARGLNVLPQSLSSQFKKDKDLTPKFLARVNKALQGYGVSLPDAPDVEVQEEVDKITECDAMALQRENKLLRQQNEFLQKLLDRMTEHGVNNNLTNTHQ